MHGCTVWVCTSSLLILWSQVLVSFDCRHAKVPNYPTKFPSCRIIWHPFVKNIRGNFVPIARRSTRTCQKGRLGYMESLTERCWYIFRLRRAVHMIQAMSWQKWVFPLDFSVKALWNCRSINSSLLFPMSSCVDFQDCGCHIDLRFRERSSAGIHQRGFAFVGFLGKRVSWGGALRVLLHEIWCRQRE